MCPYAHWHLAIIFFLKTLGLPERLSDWEGTLGNIWSQCPLLPSQGEPETCRGGERQQDSEGHSWLWPHVRISAAIPGICHCWEDTLPSSPGLLLVICTLFKKIHGLHSARMQKFHCFPPKEEFPGKLNLKDRERQGKTCFIVTASLLSLWLSPFGLWSSTLGLWPLPLPSYFGGEFCCNRVRSSNHGEVFVSGFTSHSRDHRKE